MNVELLAKIGLAILAVHALCLLFWGWRFVRLYRQVPGAGADDRSVAHASGSDGRLPRVVVLLPVRGADPSLADCLHGLLLQNYPAYEVIAILDSAEDPAAAVVAGFLTPGRLTVHVLQERRPTCSLKMSALVEVLAGLDETCEIVSLIDADVIPHADWLGELARPLENKEVGAATGIRWYAPPASAGWGTLVRYLWNAAASLHMAALHIPWGGSLALRLDTLRRSDLLTKWSSSLFEDASCYDSLRTLGLKVQFVPAATMLNRETIDMRGCCHFIRRQLLDARLYHSRWGVVLALGLLSTTALALCTAAATMAVISSNTLLAVWLGAGLLAYFLAMTSLLLWIERPIRNLTGRAAGIVRLKTVLAIPLTQVVYFACLVSACLVRRIIWRGIAYQVDGPFSVRLLEYRPFTPPPTGTAGSSVT